MNLPAKSFTDIIVWQKSHQFVINVFKTTKMLPQEELYGLTSQIRRASVSIAANIAEGFTRRTNADKLRFLNISQGSLEEVRYYLILIKDLEYAGTKLLSDSLEEVSKILGAFSRSIKNTKS